MNNILIHGEAFEENIDPDFLNLETKDYSLVSEQRLSRNQPVCRVSWEKIYPAIENPSLPLYVPRQRQKLSATAIQCGVLTSFSPNSPSLS